MMDKIKNTLYIIGLLMISWDLLGHFCCLISRLTGEKGAYLWNNYSQYIWPSLKDSISYDLFWSLWFFIALIFIIQKNSF